MKYTKIYEEWYGDSSNTKQTRTRLYATMTLAEKTAWKLLADITDRRGWGQEWDQFDEEIKEEIFASFVKIIADTAEAEVTE